MNPLGLTEAQGRQICDMVWDELHKGDVTPDFLRNNTQIIIVAQVCLFVCSMFASCTLLTICQPSVNPDAPLLRRLRDPAPGCRGQKEVVLRDVLRAREVPKEGDWGKSYVSVLAQNLARSDSI